MSEFADFRRAKHSFFREGPDSPLAPEQRRGFASLDYFAENPALRFAVKPEVLVDGGEVNIGLSTGDAATYRRWAKVSFEVEGAEVALTVFRNPESGELFLPFKDATASSGETYGAGRYLDLHQLAGGELLLDFNYAYNPYCAYNEQWSCPLTPPENVLAVGIRAGENAFVKSQ